MQGFKNNKVNEKKKKILFIELKNKLIFSPQIHVYSVNSQGVKKAMK